MKKAQLTIAQQSISENRRGKLSNWAQSIGNRFTKLCIYKSKLCIYFIFEYFNDNISPCDSNACLTCNSFISDQSFKSNLTGRIYKTQTYEQLTCGSWNLAYAIHCIRCGLMYVDENWEKFAIKDKWASSRHY